MTELGTASQKRPQIWQSDEPTQGQNVHKTQQYGDVKLELAIDSHRLEDTIRSFSKNVSVDVGVGIGDHKLVAQSLDIKYYADVTTALNVGDHKLRSVIMSAPTVLSNAKTNLGIGNQRLYNWGIYAEVLDKDNLDVTFGLGNHKLYEEVN